MAAAPIATVQVQFTSTADNYATVGGVQKITMRSSADCWIMFDNPINTDQAFKLLAANTADTTIDLPNASVQQIHVKGVSGSGTLYLIVAAD